MPKKKVTPKKPEKPTTTTTPKPPNDAPLALRLAVLEDVVKRAAQETRAFQTKLDTLAATQGELTRRVADVEKRSAR
jgi:hypothetical protein